MKNVRFTHLANCFLWQSVFVLQLMLIPGQLLASDELLVARMQAGGAVLMIRHAEAPGTGDPADFQLDDCRTQRNLSADGRQQAKSIGNWLRANGIEHARVFSSQWCRCLDTARLMGIGEVRPLAPLNSFFQRPQDREPNIAMLRAFLAEQPPDGELLVLVTHQVTISALTGEYTSSGHGKLLDLDEGGKLSFVGSLNFGQ
jgi:phosphohistidine phosphatase SixA